MEKLGKFQNKQNINDIKSDMGDMEDMGNLIDATVEAGGDATVEAGGDATVAAEVVIDAVKRPEVVSEAVVEAFVEENRRRNRLLKRRWSGYNQLTGKRCVGKRRWVECEGMRYRVPRSMLRDKRYREGMSLPEFNRLRIEHDFEFWAITCGVIKDKITGRDKHLELNAPQRRVLAALEDMRQRREPIRMILLKARQWGGSTLVETYMAWIQSVILVNWNSVICAHVKDTASTIRGMYTKLLANYPLEFWKGDAKPEFKRFENAQNIRIIPGRGCSVTIASSENQDAIRGGDFAMAHLSEVAFWKDTPNASPEDYIRAIHGCINTDPNTLIVMESTANGVGDFFHREWCRACSNKSDYEPVFVPWHEIEIYRRKVKDVKELLESMTDYEWELWTRHKLTLEMIAWFHRKARESSSLQMMLAEYPTTADEAFMMTDRNVFDPEACSRLRAECREPEERGELLADAPTGPEALEGIHFKRTAAGKLDVWKRPEYDDTEGRYVVAVDVGGRSAASDWSVIVAMDLLGGSDGKTPEVVAQWRGHCDHDLLAYNAARVASWYDNALLVFESNTLESKSADDPGRYIIEQVSNYYDNIYVRSNSEGSTTRYGFHTNRATKSMIINRLIAMVRDGTYIERCSGAVDELVDYEYTTGGVYEARRGSHDDMLMARAIALHVGAEQPPRVDDGGFRDYYERTFGGSARPGPLPYGYGGMYGGVSPESCAFRHGRWR